MDLDLSDSSEEEHKSVQSAGSADEKST